LVIAALNVQTWLAYFGDYIRRTEVRAHFHPDLVEAVEWLRPRFEQFDAVFCGAESFNMPYVVTLVALDYEPRQWFAGVREMHDGGGWDLYTRCGKMRFVFNDRQWDELAALRANGRPDHVAFIISPDAVSARLVPGIRPTKVIRSASGHALLWICEAEL
jgi:hypothetical protein